MNIVFIFPILIILLSIPVLLLYLVLYTISKYYINSLYLEFCGFLKFRNINFYIDTESYFIFIHIDYFHIFFIWIKLRFNIKGLKSSFTLKTHSSSLIKTKPINNYEFANSFVIRKGDSYNKNYYILDEIKNKFNKILVEKYNKNLVFESAKKVTINKDTKESKKQGNIINNSEYEFKKLNNNSQKSKFSIIGKILGKLLSFFDIILDNVELNFKLSESEFFYRLSMNRTIIVIKKGLNINKEIQLFFIINNLNIKEYVNIHSLKFRKILSKKFNTIKAKNEEKNNNNYKNNKYWKKQYLFDTYVEFNLINIKELLINLKLLNGFTPCDFNSFNNSIKIKIDSNNTRINISSRAIDTMVKTLKELSKYKHYLDYIYNKDIKDIKISTDINDKETNYKIKCSK